MATETKTGVVSKRQSTVATGAVRGQSLACPAVQVAQVAQLQTLIVSIAARADEVGEVAIGLTGDATAGSACRASGAGVVTWLTESQCIGQIVCIVVLAKTSAISGD